MPLTSQITVSPGYFKLGTQTKSGQPVDVAKLRIFPAQKDAPECGRWLLFVDPSIGALGGSASLLSKHLTGVAARLGLLPPRLTRMLRDDLQKPDPVALIADTSALYSGVFEQVVHMRQGLPTHLAIPDQVYMELQRQRERASKKGKGRSGAPTASTPNPSTSLEQWLAEQGGAPPIAALELVLKRLQHHSGHVLHQIRPADSLVRYFGGERGGGTGQDDHGDSGYLGDDDRIAPNFYRDRLILEAVRAEQSRLHHLPAWVITSDENLAVHALHEGFRVGYGERAKSPDPWMIGSPWVDPHTLGLRHVPAQTLLSELVHQWRTVTLQEEGKGLLQIWTKREAKEQVLGATEPYETQERTRESWKQPRPNTGSSVSVPPSTESAQQFPRNEVVTPISSSGPAQAALILQSDEPEKRTDWPLQIASLEHTINALIALQSRKPEEVESALHPKGVAPYLVGLAWAEHAIRLGTKATRSTAEGASWAQRWQAISPTDVEGVHHWWRWLAELAAKFGAETPLRKLLALLPTADGEGAEPDVLGTRLGWGRAAIQGQVALGHHLGVLVRWDGRVFRTTPMATKEEAAAIIRSQIQGPTRVDSLFIKVLKSKPMGLPSFRAGLLSLYEAGQLSPSGGLPDAADGEHKPVTLSVIVPTQQLPRKAERLEVDLANGDFLLPGVSCQVVTHREATR